jgi:flagellar biosynthesis chaperone FliJ
MTYKSLNYRQFIPVLVQAVKEQQVHIDSLRSELNALKDTLQSQGIDVE